MGDNINNDLKEIWWDVDGINLARDRDKRQAVVNTVMNIWVQWNSRNFLPSRGTVSFSIRTVLHVVMTRSAHSDICTLLTNNDQKSRDISWHTSGFLRLISDVYASPSSAVKTIVRTMDVRRQGCQVEYLTCHCVWNIPNKVPDIIACINVNNQSENVRKAGAFRFVGSLTVTASFLSVLISVRSV